MKRRLVYPCASRTSSSSICSRFRWWISCIISGVSTGCSAGSSPPIVRNSSSSRFRRSSSARPPSLAFRFRWVSRSSSRLRFSGSLRSFCERSVLVIAGIAGHTSASSNCIAAYASARCCRRGLFALSFVTYFHLSGSTGLAPASPGCRAAIAAWSAWVIFGRNPSSRASHARRAASRASSSDWALTALAVTEGSDDEAMLPEGGSSVPDEGWLQRDPFLI